MCGYLSFSTVSTEQPTNQRHFVVAFDEASKTGCHLPISPDYSCILPCTSIHGDFHYNAHTNTHTLTYSVPDTIFRCWLSQIGMLYAFSWKHANSICLRLHHLHPLPKMIILEYDKYKMMYELGLVSEEIYINCNSVLLSINTGICWHSQTFYRDRV